MERVSHVVQSRTRSQMADDGADALSHGEAVEEEIVENRLDGEQIDGNEERKEELRMSGELL